MKPVRLTRHARDQCIERGATEAEVFEVVEHGEREQARMERQICRLNFGYDQEWQGTHYAVKQVAPVIKEELDEIVVVTVYTFYF